MRRGKGGERGKLVSKRLKILRLEVTYNCLAENSMWKFF